MSELPESHIQELLATATDMRGRAYAPYSKFQVGAALRTTDGRVFTGCNVENTSYGLTVCAERNAIASAVAGGMQPRELAALVVVADTPEPVTPCGACRQVIVEFLAEDGVVIGANLAGETRQWTAEELLPGHFKL